MCSLAHRNTYVQVLIDLHSYRMRSLYIECVLSLIETHRCKCSSTYMAILWALNTHGTRFTTHTHPHMHTHTHTHTHTRARPHPRALSLSLTHSLSLTGVSDGGSTSAGTLSWPGHYCISPCPPYIGLIHSIY